MSLDNSAGQQNVSQYYWTCKVWYPVQMWEPYKYNPDGPGAWTGRLASAYNLSVKWFAHHWHSLLVSGNSLFPVMSSLPGPSAPVKLSRKERRAKWARESTESAKLSLPDPPKCPRPSTAPDVDLTVLPLAAPDSSGDDDSSGNGAEGTSPKDSGAKKGAPSRKKPTIYKKSEPVSAPVAWLESKVLINPWVSVIGEFWQSP